MLVKAYRLNSDTLYRSVQFWRFIRQSVSLKCKINSAKSVRHDVIMPKANPAVNQSVHICVSKRVVNG
jgi:hypothetical protein